MKRNDHNLHSINGLAMRKIVRGPGQTALFCRDLQELQQIIFSVLTCPLFWSGEVEWLFWVLASIVRRGHGFNQYGQGPAGFAVPRPGRPNTLGAQEKRQVVELTCLFINRSSGFGAGPISCDAGTDHPNRATQSSSARELRSTSTVQRRRRQPCWSHRPP